MQAQEHLPETDPCHHISKIKGKLDELVTHLREDVTKVYEPKAQALFETTAEVLKGLATAYSHYEQHSEQAWKYYESCCYL